MPLVVVKAAIGAGTTAVSKILFKLRDVPDDEAQEVRELLERNPSIATALNPYIGYDEAAIVAKEAAREGLSVREVVERRGLLPTADVDAALDVRSMTEPGLPEQ